MNIMSDNLFLNQQILNEVPVNLNFFGTCMEHEIACDKVAT